MDDLQEKLSLSNPLIGSVWDSVVKDASNRLQRELSFWEELIAFVHAVNWAKEPWLWALAAFHMAVFIISVKSKHYPVLRMLMLMFICKPRSHSIHQISALPLCSPFSFRIREVKYGSRD